MSYANKASLSHAAAFLCHSYSALPPKLTMKARGGEATDAAQVVPIALARQGVVGRCAQARRAAPPAPIPTEAGGAGCKDRELSVKAVSYLETPAPLTGLMILWIEACLLEDLQKSLEVSGVRSCSLEAQPLNLAAQAHTNTQEEWPASIRKPLSALD